ncbi:alkaline phosphatase family protein [Thermococcus aciditolerans]|uniref:Phosphodiesterase n=1 Tax=Thermococcus aciditolerans TaxID=2598455 RepID=A0A5C0SMR2_9EURY|nr:alkaline phosphatase family protein [Thermococcus aciditolerans]QEK15252.1 hypothetical protein FPV09_09265 [Thermococcus aciditolerans]
MSNIKVLVIGLDGATWDVIIPFVKQGKLPTFKKLLKGSSCGILKSTLPPVTVPAWPSFATGKNPAKLGIYNFLIVDNKTGKVRIVRSTDIKSKKIWNYLSFYGKKSIILNHPVTYPPEKISGIMVSGMLTPPGSNDYAHPPEILEELEKLGYIIEPDPEIVRTKWDTEEFISELIKTIRKRTDTVVHLMKTYPWDFFFVLFRATDVVQHKHFQNKKEKLLEVYSEIDRSIDILLKSVPKETVVILMSDHGFCELTRYFNITKWLYEMGYVKLKKKEISPQNSRVSILTRLGITQNSILRVLRKLHLDWIRKYLPVSLKSKLPQSSVEIDLKESLVYPGILFTGASQYLSINREKIRSEEEYEKLRNELILKLSSLKDPETGELVVEAIYKKEEIYSGPYLSDAPDIIFLLKKGYGLTTFLDLSAPFFENIYSPFGTHHVDGIFLVYGPGIKEGYKIKPAEIIDVAPTILHIFNLPIPNDMDGRVLMEIFEEDSEFAKREPKYVDPSYYEKKQEDEKLKKAIKNLKLKGKI